MLEVLSRYVPGVIVLNDQNDDEQRRYRRTAGRSAADGPRMLSEGCPGCPGSILAASCLPALPAWLRLAIWSLSFSIKQIGRGDDPVEVAPEGRSGGDAEIPSATKLSKMAEMLALSEMGNDQPTRRPTFCLAGMMIRGDR